MPAEPQLSQEGNLRFASLSVVGYPQDPWAQAATVRRLLDEQDIDPYGAVSVLIAARPDEQPIATWDCQVGLAITGMARPVEGMLVEDFRQLTALTLPHGGPIAELAATWRRLHDHGRSLGRQVRPYWRVGLRDRRLADGNLLPLAEVSVFLDR